MAKHTRKGTTWDRKKVVNSEGNIWIISLVNIENDNCITGISFFENWKIKTSSALLTFEWFNNNFQISKNNVIDEYIWKKPSNIWELQKWMLVKFGPDSTSILWKIVFISEESDTITIRNLSLEGNSNEDYSFKKFLEECSICAEKEVLINTNTNPLRSNDCKFEDLEHWMTIKFLDDNSTGKIIAREENIENILVWCENERNRSVDFSDIWTIFSVSQKDLDKPTRTDKFKINQLTKWMEVFSKNKMISGIISNVEEIGVLITTIAGNKKAFTNQKFLEKFEVNSKKLKNKTPAITQAELEDDSLWVNLTQIERDRLKKWINIRYEGQLWKYLEIPKQWWVIIEYTDSNWDIVRDSITFWIGIDILKEDIMMIPWA